MPTALSVPHIYTGTVTPGATDGDQVTEDPSGLVKILMAANRGLYSQPKALAIRATTDAIYLVKITPTGPRASGMFLSYNGNDWLDGGATLFFVSIGLTNSVFYVKALFPDDNDFGDDVSNGLFVDYLGPI